MSIIRRAPTISATITSLNGSATLNALPDTGADITAADVKVLKLLREDINNLLPPVSGPTSSVDGSPLKSLGQLPLSISFGEITANETVQIFPSIQGYMLISWRAAQRLHILSENYPSQINAINKDPVNSPQKQNNVTADDLINEFSCLTDRCAL